MPNTTPNHEFFASASGASDRDRSVLLVGEDEGMLLEMRSRVAGLASRVDRSSSAEDAARVTRGLWYDVVLIDAGLGERALEVCGALRRDRGGPSAVLYARRASLELATAAIRAGAFDLLSGECSRREFAERLALAAGESAARREAAEREAGLKRLCGKLDRARREVTGQVGELCTDLAGAYKDLSEQIGELALTGELNGLLRQELDVESLLRTFLEYLLAQVGSTNAGVFLPNTVGDYTLGAYINYDRPRESAEESLERVAAAVAPAFENERQVIRLNRPAHFRARLGEFASFFDGQNVLAVGCYDRADSPGAECLAVLCLFRDRRSPFTARAVRTVQIASELFGRQMSRVIEVHHRHMPKDLWRADDDIDLAA